MHMAHPIIGWEQESPVPDNHGFNDFLSVRGGRLYFEELDLAQLLAGGGVDQGLGRLMPSPLEMVYLPKIGQKIRRLREVFAAVRAEVGYEGRYYYAYASKANTAEEVVRTALAAGAHHEMSSEVDVDIAALMQETGRLPPERWVIANGFKPAGSAYAASLLAFKQRHDRLIPVVEDLSELPPLVESGLPFEVGLRQKCYGRHYTAAQMDAADSRFGLPVADLERAAETIAAAPNLQFRLYHAMIGSQITDGRDFVNRLKVPIQIYARLRQQYPTLNIFDFGGGVPVPMTLDFEFDYYAFARLLLTTIQQVCAEFNVPVPDVMGEHGRYTTAEHGAHFFRVVTAKDNGSPQPWYIINGSIMTSFPDSWALGEHFIVLPLNHLDKPFRRVKLGGITCDSDDIYPPQASQSPLYLPVETDNLYLGFFCIGAYQEMLGGVRGTKHCVLPEATELVVDRAADGSYRFRVIAGQANSDVMRNLGYLGLDRG